MKNSFARNKVCLLTLMYHLKRRWFDFDTHEGERKAAIEMRQDLSGAYWLCHPYRLCKDYVEGVGFISIVTHFVSYQIYFWV